MVCEMHKFCVAKWKLLLRILCLVVIKIVLQ
jgi:hypothetical protein